MWSEEKLCLLTQADDAGHISLLPPERLFEALDAGPLSNPARKSPFTAAPGQPTYSSVA